MSVIRTTPVDGPSVWRREDVEDPAGWTYELSGPMRKEISAAAERLAEAGTVGTAGRDDIALPLTAPLVEEVVEQLEHGRGLALLRGVPIEGLTLPEAHAVYWALGAHLGIPVPQNGRGERIVSIKDARIGGLAGPTVRGYQTNESLPFHTDAPDLAALLCLQQAKVGGEFSVASAGLIYNELLRTRPELLALYYAGFFYDYRGEEPAGSLPVYRNAVFGEHHGRLFCRYFLRQFADSAPAKIGLELSDAEVEALDAFEEIPQREENHVSMRLEPGDLQLVDDNSTVHRRAKYDDPGEDDEARRRHLLRLWINVHGGYELPTRMSTHRWGMQTAANVAR